MISESSRQKVLQKNWEELKKTIPPHVTLIAVSKTFPASDIEILYTLGQRDFGENYLQELAEKSVALAHLSEIRWHFIGHLQTNKVKALTRIPNLVAIHSIDSLKLLKELVKRESEWMAPAKALFFELNLGDEESKSGLSEEALPELVDYWAKLQRGEKLTWLGLMGMPPAKSEEEVRPLFSKLRVLRDNLAAKHQFKLKLSMGMSGDYQSAITEGSDFIRVGGLIFGARSYPQTPT